MTYVVSDLHGCFDLWKKALSSINFSDKDVVYILGDVLDKGDHPIDLLLNIMSDSRFKMINGNHETDFLNVYKIALNIDRTIREVMIFDEYLKNGGDTTIRQFLKCDDKTKRLIVNYLKSNSFFMEISIGNKNFVMVHGGISNFSEEKQLNKYTTAELTLHRYVKGESFFSDKTLICGHTPNLKPNNKAAEILIADDSRFYNIDCGCAFPEYGGRLGILCLETMRTTYVG